LSGLFPSAFPTKILHAFLISPSVLHVPPPHPLWHLTVFYTSVWF
jgi:hypothetical protein